MDIYPVEKGVGGAWGAAGWLRACGLNPPPQGVAFFFIEPLFQALQRGLEKKLGSKKAVVGKEEIQSFAF